MGAGGDGVGGQSGVAGGGDVGGGVANETGSPYRNFKAPENLAGQFRLRFFIIGIAVADTERDISGKAGIARNLSGGLTMFVGQDGLRDACFEETLNQFGASGKDDHAVEHYPGKSRAKAPAGLGNFFGRNKEAHGLGHGSAHAAADGGFVGLRMAEVADDFAITTQNARGLIDKGAVHIPQDGGRARQARRKGGHDGDRRKECALSACPANAGCRILEGALWGTQARPCLSARQMMAEAQAEAAELDVRSENGAVVLAVAGRWRLGGRKPDFSAVEKALAAEEAPVEVRFEADRLSGWDSALLVFVRRGCALAEARGVPFRLDGLPGGVRNMIELAQASGGAAEREPAREGREGFLTRLGEGFLGVHHGLMQWFGFVGTLVTDALSLVRRDSRPRRDDFLELLQATGARALPIVALLSFLTGLIIAFIGVIQLRKLAADIYVADLVGLAMTRELGAVMAGVIMAGRTGAAFAAHLGSMRVNEEIDALESFGIRPVLFLVVPRVLALVLMLPLLTVCASVVGMLGGMTVAATISEVGVLQYCNQVAAVVTPADLAVGVFKSAVFGAIIATAGCFRGLHCGRDAGAVGLAATSAVVTAITWIVVADAAFAVVFHILGI